MNYVEYLEIRLDALQKDIEKDKADYASTMLHRYRRRLDEIDSIRYFLHEQNKIYDTDGIDDQIRDIRKTIHERLEKRIAWQAGLIEQTIASRKSKGTYKGEFTTATILANAYNDIFHAVDHTFSGEHVECKNTWISPSEKLPELGQEVEFVAPHKFTDGSSKRIRFQGHFKAVGGNLIFYAHSIGWGCEFLIEEVECWLPKIPMPEVKQ